MINLFALLVYHLVDRVVTLTLSHGSIQETKQNWLAPHFEQLLKFCWMVHNVTEANGQMSPFILSASTSIDLLKAIGSFVLSSLFSPWLGCSVLFVLPAIPTVPHIIFCCSLFVSPGLFSAVPSLSVLDRRRLLLRHTRVDSALQRCG